MGKYTIYDLETLKNFFSGYFADFETGKEKYFIIHKDQNDLVDLVKFLRQLQRHNYTLVGFNSLAFDAQIIEHILAKYQSYLVWQPEEIAADIYKKAQEVINLPDDISRFQFLVPEWRLSIPQVDLYKQNHYDGAQKRCSLKWLEFTMRFNNIETMPIHHSSMITKDDFESIIKYNANDVRATKEFFKRKFFETELRQKLSQEYDLNLINSSETRIAKEIFAKFLCEEMKIEPKQLKEMRTHRSTIRVKDILFPYLKFEDKDLQLTKKEFERLNVDAMNLKGAFAFSVNYHGIQSDLGFGGLHGCIKSGIYEATDTWEILDLDVKSFYPNLGIENDVKPAHLGKSFTKIYKQIYETRKTIDKKDPRNYVYKIILNSTYGLSNEINSYMYDPLYTLTITMNGQLTLLMLCEMLVKKVPSLVFYQQNTDGVTIGFDTKHRKLIDAACREWEKITKLELESAAYKKMIIRDVNNYIAIKKEFEWSDYKLHLALGKSPKDFPYIKHKGIFETELDYHKNPSMLVVPKALEAYFLGDKEYSNFIRNHEDILDFCAGVKIKKDFDLVQHSYNPGDTPMIKIDAQYLLSHGWEKTEYDYYFKTSWRKDEGFDDIIWSVSLDQAIVIEYQHQTPKIEKDVINQTVLRYYVSKHPTSLKKKYKPTSKIGMKRKGEAIVEIEKGWNTTYYNIHDSKPINTYEINHKYYISEVRSIINAVQPNKQQLKLF